MYPNDAIKYLETMKNRSDQAIVIVVTEEEVRQVTGERYSDEDMKELTELLSRLPHTDDVEHNYWYEKRLMFKELIESGIGHIERRKIDDDIRERNSRLSEELGLENIIISVDHEVRPMMVVSDESVSIQQFGEQWFVLPAGSTYATLLQRLDEYKKGDGHHVYFEGAQAAVVDGQNILSVGFGS